VNKEVKVVHSKDVESITPYGPESVRLKRLITKKRVGSERILFGKLLMEPGAQPFEWSTEPGSGVFAGMDEVYYVLEGMIRIHWDGKAIEAKEGDVIYFPPGWKYKVENPGNERVIVLYATSPAFE